MEGALDVAQTPPPGKGVGVARGTINAIETGKYDPSLPLAFKIARVFGKNVEEVFLYPEEQDQARPPQV